MYFDTKAIITNDYQVIRDEKKILLDRLYADGSKRRQTEFNPFSK